MSEPTFTDCLHEELEGRMGPGRRTRYRNIEGLELPADLPLPTCSSCGEWQLTRESAPLLDRALGPAYERELREKAQEALAALVAQQVRQRDLEALLGLSAGYLSKLKNGKAEPSSVLVSCLMLLAVDSNRMRDLDALWPAGAHSQLRRRRMSGVTSRIPLSDLRADEDAPPSMTSFVKDTSGPGALSVALLTNGEAA